MESSKIIPNVLLRLLLMWFTVFRSQTTATQLQYDDNAASSYYKEPPPNYDFKSNTQFPQETWMAKTNPYEADLSAQHSKFRPMNQGPDAVCDEKKFKMLFDRMADKCGYRNKDSRVSAGEPPKSLYDRLFGPNGCLVKDLCVSTGESPQKRRRERRTHYHPSTTTTTTQTNSNGGGLCCCVVYVDTDTTSTSTTNQGCGTTNQGCGTTNQGCGTTDPGCAPNECCNCGGCCEGCDLIGLLSCCNLGECCNAENAKCCCELITCLITLPCS